MRYPETMSPRKALSHLLLAVLVVGGVGCPCPATAITGDEAPIHQEAHHDRAGELTAETDGREHSQCQADCNYLDAEASRKDPYSFAGKPPLDPDIEALEPETVAWPGVARAVTWTGLPPQSSRLPRETPVRRFDRLLD